MRARVLLLAGLAACCLVGCGALAKGSDASTSHTTTSGSHSKKAHQSGTNGLQTVSVMSGGHLRSYLLYVPPGDSATNRLPLVLVYHGVGETAIVPTTATGLLSVAESQHNMILAFLQGYDDSWNEGAGNTPAHAAGINDVAFTATVLQRIETNYDVDMTRVVATGYSNGALLTELLGCRLAANLTLISPVEGQLPVTVSSSCRPSAPISVYEVHGTADTEIPYSGGHFNGVGGGTTVLSAPVSVARWAKLDGCTATSAPSRSGSVTLTGYQKCGKGVKVTLDTIEGGQHVWPAGFGQTLANVISSLPATRVAKKP